MIKSLNKLTRTLTGQSLLFAIVLGLSGSASISMASEDKHDAVKEAIKGHIATLPIDSIADSVIPGLYEMISDGAVYYVSEDGNYLIDGQMIELATRKNLTSEREGSLHLALINEVPESEMLIYPAANDSQRSITVFTDISCGYCRKLHQEIDELLEGGVRVRYLMFPRAGIDSPAAKDLESVWCAENPQEAMTSAKAGETINPMSCENPIESHVSLARQVGLRGTPLIYLDNGQKVAGYKPAKLLIEMVNSSEPM